MKFIYLVLLLVFSLQTINSQEIPEAEIYLITCGPGTETYSVYGHSALRIVIPEQGSDLAYNWGVFDFDTPNFAWKFAQGRLNYMLGVYPYERFLRDYFLEQRWVISQKLNLEKADIERLFRLLEENLKPENVKYRYDFYYDNCSTRIRDLIEKAIGEDLLYPPAGAGENLQTFRNLTAQYEKGNPWTKMGIDLLIGSPGDKKASFRDRMFLPVDLKNGLSELTIGRHGKTIPVLQNPVIVLDFDPPAVNEKLLKSPLFLLSLLLIIIIILTGTIRTKAPNRLIDIILFAILSMLAILMLFFNFVSDHPQLKWNLNIIWLNPFIIVCLVILLLRKERLIWFRLIFYVSFIFLLSIVILPQQINNAFIPLIIILILRSSVRAGFKWNPLTLPYLTQL